MSVDEQASACLPGTAAHSADNGILTQMSEMFDKLRGDIKTSEKNTGAKIETLAENLTDRLDKAEKDVAKIRSDLNIHKTRARLDAKTLPDMIEKIVARKLAEKNPDQPLPSTSKQRPRPLRPGSDLLPTQAVSASHADKYWLARRSLRCWPVQGEDFVAAAVCFIRSTLKCPESEITAGDITVKSVPARPGVDAKSEVIVYFDSIMQRDRVKALARNLKGNNQAGVQLEPPDHLRSHYQTLQSLAFHIKRKHPGLRRSLKFTDHDMDLVMDFRLSEDSDWKTVCYDDAKAILKKRDNSIPRNELEQLVEIEDVNKTDNSNMEVSDPGTDDDDVVDLTTNDSPAKNSNKTSKPSRSLSFINANARSLGPKLESLYDCLFEKDVDIALSSET